MPKKYTLGRQSKGSLIDLELPSGETCQVRRPGVQGFIAAGILDNFDQLTSLVQTEHIDKNSTRPQTSKKPSDPAEWAIAEVEMMRDPEKLEIGFRLMDRLCAYVIVQPPVWVDYQLKDESDEDWEKRSLKAEQDGTLGLSEVDLEDKLFIVQFAVGGSSDLEAFREGLKAGMDNMAAISKVSGPTE